MIKTIDELIQNGDQILKEKENRENMRAMLEETKRVSGWQDLYEKAILVLDPSIRLYLKLPNAVDNGSSSWAPSNLDSYFYWTIEIPGLAPIQVEFAGNEHVKRYKIDFKDPVDKTNGYTFLHDDEGVGLSCALAAARRVHDRVVEIETAYENYLKEEEELSREPEYIDTDGSEPLPDAVLLSGLRRLIREEVSKINID